MNEKEKQELWKAMEKMNKTIVKNTIKSENNWIEVTAEDLLGNLSTIEKKPVSSSYSYFPILENEFSHLIDMPFCETSEIADILQTIKSITNHPWYMREYVRATCRIRELCWIIDEILQKQSIEEEEF
jgi:hypothetical protein